MGGGVSAGCLVSNLSPYRCSLISLSYNSGIVLTESLIPLFVFLPAPPARPPSEDVARHGFTVIVDMRGSKWDSIKPLLKILQESFPSCIHVALIIKPDNFWQKQRTNFGSSKFEFEVGAQRCCAVCVALCVSLCVVWSLCVVCFSACLSQ